MPMRWSRADWLRRMMPSIGLEKCAMSLHVSPGELAYYAQGHGIEVVHTTLDMEVREGYIPTSEGEGYGSPLDASSAFNWWR